MGTIRYPRLVHVTGAVALLFLTADRGRTDDQEFEELKARVVRQEQQIEYLHRLLGPGFVQAATDEKGGDKKQIEQAVADYLKAQDKQKEAARKKEAEQFVEVGSVTSGESKWNAGLQWESKNKDFKFHVGGRVQNDWGWFAPDDALEPRGWSDGAGFRRLRVRADGTAWEVVTWNAEVDFANSTPRVTDTYMEIIQLPFVGNFRAGHFYEPFSLENWGVSDNWITFIERAPVIDALDPERNVGMILHNTAFDQRMFWAIGVYRPNSEDSGFAEDSGDGEYSYTGRLTFNPIYEADGRCWVHFGGAYSFRSVLPIPAGTIANPEGDNPRFRTRIPVRTRGTTFVNAERVIDTGNIIADSIQLYNVQAAAAFGPLSVQGEIIRAQVDNWVRGDQFRDPAFWGYYVYVSYFLTGEHRPYNRRIAGIGMPVPHEPFFLVRSGEPGDRHTLFGSGAWEVALRYGHLDLGSPDINLIDTAAGPIPRTSDFQGHINDITLGLNWYLNPNFRIMWNYVYARINGLDISPTTQSGDVHNFGMRFSFFF